jgi:nicotinamidase-related amidase
VRDRLFERAAWIAAAARELEIPAIVTEEDAARNGETAAAVAKHLRDGYTTFAKSTFDVASQPDVLAALLDTGRRTAVLIGMETDVCIAQSAAGLSKQDFRVLVVSDAVASPAEDHHLGLERIRHLGIEITTVKALYYEWTRTVSHAREVKARIGELSTGGIRF